MMLKKIILITLTVKICIFLIIIFGFSSNTFNQELYKINLHYPDNEKITLQTAFKTWDAQHYLYLSENWYKPNHESNRFYPLLPLLIRLLTPLISNSLFAGLFISNILSVLGIIFFYLFTKKFFNNSKLAFTSIILLLAFPTGFYFSLVYTESLFFFLIILFFYFLYNNKFKYASIFALLLPLARAVGIFVIIPFAFYLLQSLNTHFSYTNWRSITNKLIKAKYFFFLLSPLIGFIIYLVIMYLSTQSITNSVDIQRANIGGWQISYIFHPEKLIYNLLSPLPPYHTYLNSGIDRLFFLLYIFSLYFIYKKLDKTLFIYSLTVGFVPIFGTFISYTRYLLMVFPLFMVGAIYFNSIKNRAIQLLIIGLLIIFQMIFIIYHTLYYWIA